MQIYFVTSNQSKVLEAKNILKQFGIEIKEFMVDVPEIKTKTLEETSRWKAVEALKIIGKELIVEDTGIFFKAYRNFPGVCSRTVFDAIGYEGIFKLLNGKPREAWFETVVTYINPEFKLKSFKGICQGSITTKILGKIDKRFPYDSVFKPLREKRVFAEMSKEEKAKYSHRGKALEKFATWYIKAKKERII